MRKVAVIGGGITGLSTAHYLLKFGKAFDKFDKVVLIEASKRCGGWIQTKKTEHGSIHESGPKSLRAGNIAAMNTLMLVS